MPQLYRNNHGNWKSRLRGKNSGNSRKVGNHLKGRLLNRRSCKRGGPTSEKSSIKGSTKLGFESHVIHTGPLRTTQWQDPVMMMKALSWLVRIFGKCSTIHSPPALFVFCCLVEISSHTLIPLCMSGSVHSGSARWEDSGFMFPEMWCASSFLDSFPHYAWIAAWSAHFNFLRSRVYACLSITCHLYFWQNDWGLLRATAV